MSALSHTDVAAFAALVALTVQDPSAIGDPAADSLRKWMSERTKSLTAWEALEVAAMVTGMTLRHRDGHPNHDQLARFVAFAPLYENVFLRHITDDEREVAPVVPLRAGPARTG